MIKIVQDIDLRGAVRDMAKRAFEAMMEMRKIDVAKIEAACAARREPTALRASILAPIADRR